ncbi:MAG: phosphoserine phosphatase SerB [Halobacteriovoraceae bacterium]|nr:phosphoserine phosphatase SerB [Halobacteriovoraceae bacterium]
MPQTKQILITVSGQDKPGITSKLVKTIIEGGGKLTNMGQAVTHGLLSLSLVFNKDGAQFEQDLILKNLLFEAKHLGLEMDYKYLDDNPPHMAPYVSWEKFILNCVSPKDIPTQFVHDVSSLLADHNININRIDNVTPVEFKSLEMSMSLPPNISLQELKKDLLKIGGSHRVDVAFLKDNIFRRNKRLIVFDMDSTLIQTEVIDEMAKAAGVEKEVKEITELAMNGKVDFDESLIKRVQKLKGLEVSKLQEILESLPFNQGVEEFVGTVKSLGYKLALISGGFSFFADALKEKLGLDYAFANSLEVQNKKLTGRLKGTIVNPEQKALLVNLLAQQEGISLEQVVAIGDGANDIPMLSTAGLGIAFHAKEVVKREAENHMSFGPMTSILYFLGIPGPVRESVQH